MSFNVEEYLSKLPDNVKKIDLDYKNITYIPDLLRFKKLDKKYESIIEGDKIYIVNLLENPYKISVIGFPTTEVPEEINTFINKYINK